MLLERSGLIILKFHGIEIKVATQPQGCAQSVQYLQCVQSVQCVQCVQSVQSAQNVQNVQTVQCVQCSHKLTDSHTFNLEMLSHLITA